MAKKECRSCRWYDPTEGFCAELEFYCHGHDGKDCETWEPERVRRQAPWTIAIQADPEDEHEQ